MPDASQLAAYFDYLRFPTVSADPGFAPAMRDCAAWLGRTFAGLGFGVESHGGSFPPIVVAKSAPLPGRPTMMIYGHYDVQPPEPVDLWRTPPFEPAISGGFVFARGATDNKGQTIGHILGTAAHLAEFSSLPVNLIYVLEGEEEIGSPHFAAFLAAHAADLACDVVVISDTSLVSAGHPAITCGLRGIAHVKVTLRGAATDLHSGVFGGAIPNPATELCRVLAALHDSAGRIAGPGFYDGIIDPLPEELASWRGLPVEQGILEGTGGAALAGEQGYSTAERVWARPTAEINGLTSGYQGAGTKTIIPAEASAKLSFRLVPGQKSQEVAAKIGAFLRERCPESVRLSVEYGHCADAYYADPTTRFWKAAHRAVTRTFQRAPAYTREGLSIPVVSHFKRILGAESILIGLGLPDCGAHAPNESFPLAHLDRGIALHRALLEEIAQA